MYGINLSLNIYGDQTLDASERTIRNEEEEEWNEALTYYCAPRYSWNVTRHPGCTLSGHVMVDKAPGKFLIHAQ